MQIMFMWSSSTPCRAEKWSCTSPARTPGILFAQTEAPTPLPQTATPRSTAPAATARASGMTKVGIIVARVQAMRSEIDYLAPRRGDEQPILLSSQTHHDPWQFLRACHPPRLYSAASCPAAARSASSRACSRRTRPAGMDKSPSRSRRSISTFSLPVTTQSTRRARLSIGYVNVIRRLPW